MATGKTVAALHAQADTPCGYVLFFEGLDVAVTNDVALAGTGVSSWIGTAYGTRTIKHGLILPESIKVSTSLSGGKMPEDFAKFGIQDHDDSWASLFRAERDEADYAYLDERLAPTEDPALATKISLSSPTETIWARHIGTEYIGSSGERRQFWIAPAGAPPGLDHVPPADTNDSSSGYPRISTDPIVFAGRKVALYRIVQDDDGTWPSWLDQYNGGSMIWFGTLRDSGEVQDKLWSIECFGPASWHRKALFQNTPPQLAGVSSAISLSTDDGNDETGFGCWFKHRTGYGVAPTDLSGYLSFHGNGDLDGLSLNGLASQKAIADKVISNIAAIIDGTSENVDTGTAFLDTDPNERGASMEDLGAQAWIRIKAATGAFGVMSICMHRKAWAALGWDPIAQAGLPVGHAQKVAISIIDQPGPHEGIVRVSDGEHHAAPGPGYLTIHFSTWSGSISGDFGSASPDNEGAARWYDRFWEKPVIQLDPGHGQELLMGWGRVAWDGQVARRPNPDLTIGGTSVNRSGWLLFKGKIDRGDGDGPVDHVQIAKVDWVDDSGEIGLDANAEETALVVDYWEDPRTFGLPYRRPDRTWNFPIGAVEVYPLSVVGGQAYKGPDIRHSVLCSMFHASGTVDMTTTWPYTAGTNHVADDTLHGGTLYWGGDVEVADAGLGIPAAYLDADGVFEEAKKLPQGWWDPINRWRLGVIGGVQAQEASASLLSGAGWAWSWIPQSDGPPKFGVFSPWKYESPQGITVTLVDTDKAGDPKRPQSFSPRQRLRPRAPVDNFKVSARHDPIGGGKTVDRSFRSVDSDRRYRGGNVDYPIQDLGLADPSLFVRGEDPDFYFWDDETASSGIKARWQDEAGNFMAARHFELRVTIQRPKGHLLGPGSLIMVTDPRPANPTGGYGLTSHVARVLEADYVVRGKQHGAVRLRLLVQARAASQIRTWAPAGRVWGFDTGASKLYLAGNIWADGHWLGDNAANVDAANFAAQAWMTTTGAAKIRVVQSFDGGQTWGDEWTATVSSVDASENSISYTSASGTLYRDTDKLCLLQVYDNQTANTWPTTYLSVVTEADGDFGGSSTQGFKLI